MKPFLKRALVLTNFDTKALLISLFFTLWGGLFASIGAQPQYTFNPNQAYLTAIEQKTRATIGVGERYFQNSAAYEIKVRLNPQTHWIEASQKVVVQNNSASDWRNVYFHLRQNIYKENAVRNRYAENTGGIELLKLEANGRSIPPNIQGTILQITPYAPLRKGQSMEFMMQWKFKMPQKSFRMGYDAAVHFAGYWYPQLAVFDDIQGWDTEQYLGNGEFYMDWANYKVSIEVPNDYLVAATGELQNAPTILKPEILARLANLGDKNTKIVNKNEPFTKNTASTTTWAFSAQNVRDFAFGISKEWIWESRKINLNENSVVLNSFYTPTAPNWDKSLDYLGYSLQDLSKKLIPYPYPQMTTCEGFLGGGMEYPQLIFIGQVQSEKDVFSVTYHETAHQWFPMVVGTDENSFAWMDEGLATYLEHEAVNAYFLTDTNDWVGSLNAWHSVQHTGREVPMLLHTDAVLPYENARYVAAYDKLALILRYQESISTKLEVQKRLQNYAQTWQFKHPYPYDFFNILHPDFKDFGMYYEATHTLDLSLEKNDNHIKVKANGTAHPYKLEIRLHFTNGTNRTETLTYESWSPNATGYEASLPIYPALKSVQLDPEMYFIEINRQNNGLTLR